jgi:predicted AAA+ superfamily ATPase
VSRSKRLIKSPKLYWCDTGLAASLVGMTSKEELRSSPLAGALLENLVLTGLLAWRETCQPAPEIFYWRTAGGAEVDLVIEDRRRLLPVEVKSARRARAADARHLELFLDDQPERTPFGLLLHDSGGEPAVLTRRVVAAPVSLFL